MHRIRSGIYTRGLLQTSNNSEANTDKARVLVDADLEDSVHNNYDLCDPIKQGHPWKPKQLLNGGALASCQQHLAPPEAVVDERELTCPLAHMRHIPQQESHASIRTADRPRAKHKHTCMRPTRRAYSRIGYTRTASVAPLSVLPLASMLTDAALCDTNKQLRWHQLPLRWHTFPP